MSYTYDNMERELNDAGNMQNGEMLRTELI